MSTDSNFKWYMIKSSSGFEKKFVANLQKNAEMNSCSADFEDFCIPTVEDNIMQKGHRVVKEKTIYPGYVFAKMNMSPKVLLTVKKTDKFAGFPGQKKNDMPIPMKNAEFEKMISSIGEVAEKHSVPFCIGDSVVINDGTFQSFKGSVLSIDVDKQTASVSVVVFGRESVTQVPFEKLDKVSS